MEIRIPKSWPEFRSQVAVQLMIAILFALGAAVWGALRVYAAFAATQVGTLAAFGAAAVIFFAIIGAWNQLQQMDERATRRKLSRRTAHDMREQIWSWLRQYKFSAKDVGSPPLDFAIEADDDRKAPVTIAKEPNTPWITVVGNYAVQPEHRQTFIDHARDITTELLRLGLDYTFIPEQQSPDGMMRVQVRHLFLFDAETSALALLRAIAKVRNGVTATVLSGNPALAELGPDFTNPPKLGPNSARRPSKGGGASRP